MHVDGCRAESGIVDSVTVIQAPEASLLHAHRTHTQKTQTWTEVPQMGCINPYNARWNDGKEPSTSLYLGWE